MQNYIASDVMDSDYSASDDDDEGEWDAEQVYKRKI
jgi:hypothetical protein